jgi:hypothetical protein
VVVAFLAFHHAVAGHALESAKYAEAAVDLGYPKDVSPLPSTYELIALREKRYADAADIVTKTLDVRDPDHARAAEVARLVYAALADPGRRSTRPGRPRSALSDIRHCSSGRRNAHRRGSVPAEQLLLCADGCE